MYANTFKITDDFINKLIKLKNICKFTNDLIGNMDETPFLFNMSSSNIKDHKGKKSIIVKAQNQEKWRISALLCILADGSKLPPYLIYKGNKDSPLLKKVLDTNEFVKKKVFYTFNENAWYTAEVMIDWIKQVWKNYIFSLGDQFNSLLILDYATSHLSIIIYLI